MSTLNCEKENLLGQTVLVKRPLSNFEKGTFFLYTLYIEHCCVLLLSLADWLELHPNLLWLSWTENILKTSFTLKYAHLTLSYHTIACNIFSPVTVDSGVSGG